MKDRIINVILRCKSPVFVQLGSLFKVRLFLRNSVKQVTLECRTLTLSLNYSRFFRFSNHSFPSRILAHVGIIFTLVSTPEKRNSISQIQLGDWGWQLKAIFSMADY